LLPREHGAYAELLFPLATGLSLGRATVPSYCFAFAAVVFFFLHEPVAIINGVRGERLRELWTRRATMRIVLLASAGTAAGLIAMVAASPEGRLAVLAPLACSGVLVPAFATGRLKGLVPETLVIAAMSSIVMPVAVSGGVEWALAWLACGVWFVSFLLGTIAVHAIKAKHKPATRSSWSIVAAPLLGLLTIAAGVVITTVGPLPPKAALALVPAGVTALIITAVHVHPRQLKTVGWSLVASNLATWLVLIAT
jgi:hypothetical protein